MNMQRFIKYSKRMAWLALLMSLLLVTGFLVTDQISPLPDPYGGDDFATVVVAADGTPLRAFADANGVWRYPVSLEDVSPLYVEALLTYEDRWFYDHPGVNPIAMLRAAWQGIRNGRIISGGSTITMQVARIIDPHERNFSGKLKQMFRAVQLERRYSKQQILEIYLNLAPFGGTVEGVQAASYAYLGKPALELSHGDAALLAVLPQAPSRFRPDRNPERAQRARDKVLNRLARFEVWPALTVAEAKQEYVYSRPFQQPFTAPLLARRLKNISSASATRADQQSAVRTTIDFDVQQQLEMALLNRTSAMPDGVSAAVLVMRNHDLAVQAYIGSADFNNDARFGHVDMVAAKRSPGSTLKPFLYGFAIEDGLLHSASLLVDAPQSFYNYRPGNFADGFAGPVTVQDALQRSLNLPAVDVLDRLGARKFSARMASGGIHLQLPVNDNPNLTVILGGVATNLESLVGGYAALARGGVAGQPRYQISEPLQERYMLSPGAAWITREMLRDQDRPDRPQHNTIVSQGRQVAWKTGTSYGLRDAWAVGVVDDYTVGVWVGRPDGTPTPGQYGAKTALPILLSVIDGLPPARFQGEQPPASQQPPSTVAAIDICWPLGKAARDTPAEQCHQQHTAWTLNDMVPLTLPDRDQQGWLPNPQSVRVASDSHKRLPQNCQLAGVEQHTRSIASWPQALRPWLSGAVQWQSKVPAIDPRCISQQLAAGDNDIVSQTRGVKIRYPADDTELRPLPGSNQLPVVDLRAQSDSESVYWIVDGVTIGQTEPEQVKRYAFAKPGRYQISVVDADGSFDSITVNVRR